MKTAKYYIRKYRAIKWILLIPMLSLIPVIYLNAKSITVMLLCYMAICLVGVFANRIITRKVLLSVLVDDLNAPLFRQIVRRGKFAGVQMFSEYYCGNFGNVVEICRKRLADPKGAKKGRYMYLGRLAAVYYLTGDDENLRAVCQEVEQYLTTEKPSIKRNQAAYIKIFDFYNSYLAGDWETCEKLDVRQEKTKVDRIAAAHSHARLALAKGEIERAKELFEEARQAPNLCYAACADEGLRAIEEGTPYGEGLEPLATTEDFYVLYPTKANRFFSRVLRVGFVLMCILLWVSAAIELKGTFTPEPQQPQTQSSQQKIQQLAQNFQDYERFKEDLRVLVEKDYDNVEVLGAFNLRNASNEPLDSMFLFKTKNSLLLACCYIHTGDEETYYYKVQTFLLLSDLEKPSMVHDFSFDCVTSDASVNMRYCVEKASIPANDGYLTFDVNGKTVYLVLLSVQEE